MSIIVFILNNIKVSSVYFKTKINCFVFHPLCRSSSSRISKLVPNLSRDFFRSSCCNFFKQFQASKLSSRFSLGISAEVSPEIFLNGSRGISPEVSLKILHGARVFSGFLLENLPELLNLLDRFLLEFTRILPISFFTSRGFPRLLLSEFFSR